DSFAEQCGTKPLREADGGSITSTHSNTNPTNQIKENPEMKRYLLLAAILIMAFATVSIAQPQATASPSPATAAKPKPRMNKAQILKKHSANETAPWNAWKNKDAQPSQMLLTAYRLNV